MAKVRVLGPKARLDDVLRVLQDFGLLHLNDASSQAGLATPPFDARSHRHRRHVTQAIDDIDNVFRLLGTPPRTVDVPVPTTGECARWARQARSARRQAQRIVERETGVNEERALIERYRDFLNAVLPIVKRISQAPRLTSYAVVIPASSRNSVERLSEVLRREIGPEFALTSRVLRGGDVAVLLVLPREFSTKLEARLAEAHVPEAPLPIEYTGMPLEQAIPKMIQRLDEIPRELAQWARERRELTHRHGAALSRASAAMHDWLARVDARGHCGVTAHAFSVEGWLPESRLPELTERLQGSVPEPVVVESVGKEEWRAEDAPVVLSNPRLFRPFESIVGLLPLPRYGTIDPTPFVAVFFPMIFGMIMGDVGYGLMLALLSVVVRARARAGSFWRSASEIAVPCAAFAVIFGVLYGEFFGDLGRHLFGMRALAIDREESVTAALTFAIAIGGVHVLLGLVLGVITAARHEPRHALGRGVSALMVILIVIALLAAFDVLPRAIFSPTVVALLVAFPILVILEGFVAPIELLATLGNVLSYARIMALGTASVMLAVVANQMVGAMGRTVVGVVFALLFHLVNFAIGMFSPTIHAMRLHFVEFFGKFYSPGGRQYEPFSHWRRSTGR
jgi:V/A-type H+-transporting ATPase subunit I